MLLERNGKAGYICLPKFNVQELIKNKYLTQSIKYP